ncbi:MAG: hypothetical protein ACLP6G_00195 [Terriglobales bacterium]
MKKYSAVVGLLLLAVASAVAAPNVGQSKVLLFPKALTNAQYVYVASFDGDQFDPNLLPDDRAAIINVQDALRQWGRYIVVYRRQEADMVLLVQSRPTEDVIEVYDAHLPGSGYLWRAMGRGGLQKGETPLVSRLRQAVETASK